MSVSNEEEPEDASSVKILKNNKDKECCKKLHKETDRKRKHDTEDQSSYFSKTPTFFIFHFVDKPSYMMPLINTNKTNVPET